jgi:carboxymethylenebutenolidase
MTAQNVLTDSSGKPLPGYLNVSAGDGKPVLLVNHEWWGVNDQIRRVADRFAKEGFITFVPDLYHGQLANDPEGASALMKKLDWGRAVQDVMAAVAALRAHFPGAKVGVTGFCMGGAVSFAAASAIPDLAACVPFYGIPAGADLSRIRAPVLAHFAKHDDWCTPELVDRVEGTLKKAGVRAEIHRYDAHHAFFNEDRKEVHSPEHAKVAWERTIAFLNKTLS